MDLPCGMMSSFHCFADDSKMLSVHGQKHICVLPQDVMLLEQWCNKNNMVLNVDKCHMLSFSKCHCDIGLTDCPIESLKFYEDLGVTISSDFPWNIQIANACRKSIQSLQVLKRNCSPLLRSAQKLNHYKSMVLQTLSYGYSVWYANVGNMKIWKKYRKYQPHGF